MPTTQKGQRVLILTSWRQAGRRSSGIHTFTVEDLIAYLENQPSDMPVLICGYDGYQYCGIEEDSFDYEEAEE